MSDIIDLVVDEQGNYVPENEPIKKKKAKKVYAPPKTKKVRRKRVRKKKHGIKESGQEFLTGIKAGLTVVDGILSTLNKFKRGL